jgi:uncharacterized membrane protein (DUF106 family)
MAENNLTYTDEKGNTLFGFSQSSLDKNTFWIRLLVVLMGLLLIYILWLTWYVISNGVVNNIVRSCMR